jgi:hypothetical protein
LPASSREYVGKSVSIPNLTADIEEFFQNSGYKTQRADQEKGNVVQARRPESSGISSRAREPSR